MSLHKDIIRLVLEMVGEFDHQCQFCGIWHEETYTKRCVTWKCRGRICLDCASAIPLKECCQLCQMKHKLFSYVNNKQ